MLSNHLITIIGLAVTLLTGIVATKKSFSSISHLLKLIPIVLADGKVTKAEALALLEASKGIAISLATHFKLIPKSVINAVTEAIELYDEAKEINKSV